MSSVRESLDSVLQCSFHDIRFCVRDKLADCFDCETGNHWKHLACKCGLDTTTIQNIDARQIGKRPTHVVFEYWKQRCPSATIQDFVIIAETLDRYDALKVLVTAHTEGTLFHNRAPCDSQCDGRDDRYENRDVSTQGMSVTISVVPTVEGPQPRIIARCGGGTGQKFATVEDRNDPVPNCSDVNHSQTFTHPQDVLSQTHTRRNGQRINNSQNADNCRLAGNCQIVNPEEIIAQVDLSDSEGPRTLCSQDFTIPNASEHRGQTDRWSSEYCVPAEDESQNASDPRNLRRSTSEVVSLSCPDGGVPRPPGNPGTWPKQNPYTTRRPQTAPWPNSAPNPGIQPPRPSPNRMCPPPAQNNNNIPSICPVNRTSPPQPYLLRSTTVESVPRPVPRARPKIFVTYASDLKKSVMFRNLLENLTRNNFEVHLDMKRGDFVKITADRVGWLTDCFESCDFVVVCCSPKYIEEALLKDVPEDTNDRSLNTRYIASLMQTEHREKASRYERFIPVLMNDCKSIHVPIWLRNTIIYHWPKEYQDLMGRLAHGNRQVPRHSTGTAPTILQVSHKGNA